MHGLAPEMKSSSASWPEAACLALGNTWIPVLQAGTASCVACTGHCCRQGLDVAGPASTMPLERQLGRAGGRAAHLRMRKGV